MKIKADVKGRRVNLRIKGQCKEVLIETATLIDDLFNTIIEITPKEVQKELSQEFLDCIYNHVLEEKIEKISQKGSNTYELKQYNRQIS